MASKKLFFHLTIIMTTALTIGLSFGLLFCSLRPESCTDVDGFGELGASFARDFDFNGSVRRAPVYPALIGITYMVFGIDNHVGIIVLQSIILGLIGLSVYRISFSLFDNDRIAFWTALCTVLHPIVWWYVPRLWIELTYALFVLWMVFAAIRAIQNPTYARLILFGALCGLATLCKAVTMLFPLFLAGAATLSMILKISPFRHINGKALIRIFTIPTIAMLLIIAPWTVRNKVVSGKWIAVSSNVGVEFFRGTVFADQNSYNIKKTIPEIWDVAMKEEKKILAEHGYPEGERPGFVTLDRIFNPLMIEFITQQPARFAKKIIKQLPAFWTRGETFGKSLVFLGFAVISLFLFAGGFFCFNNRLEVYIIVICILYFNLLYAAVLAWARYSMPLYPLLMLAAIPFVLRITGIKQP